MKINSHSYANKTNFHEKSFALSLSFMMRFTETLKWPHFGGFLRFQPRSQGLSPRPWERQELRRDPVNEVAKVLGSLEIQDGRHFQIVNNDAVWTESNFFLLSL